MTITLAVLLGFALDWLLGDPKKLPHPVCAVGKLISGTEKVLRRIFPATPASLTFAGILLWIITCGVSGAIQFTACMNASEHIVAINTDRTAPIFETAHVAIVGDLYDTIPVLINELKEARA